MPRLVAAPDKFRGTATAATVASSIAAAARAQRASCIEIPLSDGGEGFLEVFGGANRTTTVTGPLGDPVDAGWRLTGRTAVIEMALASGLALVGGPEGNDPVAASTTGTGELVRAAVEAGARRILVGHGGSATTDGGLDALRAMSPAARLTGVDLVAAVDVRTGFLDAADVFAAQKGATPSQVAFLRRRLERLAQVYLDEHGVDVTAIPGAGAAGGLAGGLAAVGARVESGFELIADEVDLAAAIEDANLVVTGEGFVDEASFDGKVVGGVAELADELGVPLLVVAGALFDDVGDRVEAISLVERFGEQRALSDTAACITEAVADWIGANLAG